MIEEIKKELLNCDVEILYGKFGEEYKYLKHSDVVKLLDKYKNQENKKEFDLRNYEHYKYYYQDTSKEEIIQDTWLDYCAYKNMIEKNTELEKQLDIANKKLDKLDNEIKSVIKIVRQQPSESVEDDAWILGRLDGFLSIIGSD